MRRRHRFHDGVLTLNAEGVVMAVIRMVFVLTVLLAGRAELVQAQGEYSVGVGMGTSYGGLFGAGTEYREGDFSGWLGMGTWNGEIGFALGGRGRFGVGEKRTFWELGLGPIAHQWTVDGGGDVDVQEVYTGVYFTVGYALPLGKSASLEGSLGIGYNGDLSESALGRPFIPTGGLGIQVKLAALGG